MKQGIGRQALKRFGLMCLALLGTMLLLFVFLLSASSRAAGAFDFGDGLPLQQVDPDGRNSVQFRADYGAPPSATLQLYALSPGQFITIYNSLPTSWWSGTHLDPSGLPLVAEWQEAISGTYQWQKATLPGVPAGFYMLALVDGAEIQDELLVVLSRDALALKASVSGDVVQVLAWANRLSTGEPLSGAAITIYDGHGLALASGLTGPDGIYVAELAGADPEGLVAIAALDGELSACGTRWEWQSDLYSPVVNAAPHKVYLYTDRPIYRPGHTVYYKGILRSDDDGAYAPLASTQALTLAVRDARDNVLATMNPSASSFGTISGSFTLAEETGLGEYHLELLLDGHTHRQSFKVEEYRKPDYAVTVSTPASFYVWGDAIPVTVTSDYYFGQPVVGAEVQFALYRRSGYYYSYDELLWQTTGETDEHGRWTTLVNTDEYAASDATYTLEATVSDESNQSVSGDVRVPVYYAEYGLSMSLDKYGYAPDEDIDVSLLAQEHDGSPAAGAPLTVTARGWVYGSGYEDVVRVLSVTDQDGEALVTFQAPKSGWYELQAQGRDGRGRMVTARGWFWVYYPGEGWYGETDEQLSVSADKASYAPGDVAQLLVRSPVSGTALLSLERGRTRRAYPVLLTDTVTLLSLPIESDYAPNVFATIAIFQRNEEPDDVNDWNKSESEGRLLLGSVELNVPVTDRALQVELLPDRTTYRPRETVTFTIQALDQAGEPVQAHVSLGLVDEAIYALSEDLSADIHETFYGRRDNRVLNYDSLHPIRSSGYWDSPSPSATATPESLPPVGGGAERDDSDDLRRDFPDTAYWNPNVLTDEQGRAVISLTLPDNLTRWRALARAVSTDTLVGEATAAITVTQELLVRPALPRFLIQGDLVQLRTVAHNYLAHEVTATMEVSASGLTLLGADCETSLCLPPAMTLPPGGKGVADWSAVASDLGEGLVLARLRADSGTALPLPGDAVELPLPVYPFAVPEVINRVGQVEREITETFYLSVTAIPDASSLRVRLSSSIALGLLDGLEYLIGFPYG